MKSVTIKFNDDSVLVKVCKQVEKSKSMLRLKYEWLPDMTYPMDEIKSYKVEEV